MKFQQTKPSVSLIIHPNQHNTKQNKTKENTTKYGNR